LDYDSSIGAYKYCNNTNYLKIKNLNSCTFSISAINKYTHTTNLQSIGAMALSEDKTKLYTINQFNNRFTVFDVSTWPAPPVLLGQVQNANLNESMDLKVYGNYAFVIGRGTDNVVVIDVSNPASPAYVTNVQAAVTSEMANIWGIGLSPDGKYAYTVSWGAGAGGNKCYMHTIDISTPTAPSVVNSLNLSDGGVGASDQYCNKIMVHKGYAFISWGEGYLVSVSLANPASPVYSGKASSANLSDVDTFDISDDGNYIFLSSKTSNKFSVVNITNPASPAYSTAITDATKFAASMGVRTVGKYVLVTGQTNDYLTIIDVSTPTAPTIATSATNATYLDGAYRVDVIGNIAVVAARDGSSISYMQLGCDATTGDYGNCFTSAQVEYFPDQAVLAYCDGHKWRQMAGGIADNLVLHFSNADASTTITDTSASAHACTAVGNAQIDTAQYKYTGSSLLLDGSGDYVTSDGSGEFAFGTGDFSIDMWVRLNATGSNGNLYDSRPNATNGAYLTIYRDNADSKIKIWNNGGVILASTTTVSTGAWYHVAVTRYNGTIRLFINGTAQGAPTLDSTNYANPAGRPWIGAQSDSAGSYWNGWIDEVRVVKGFARWTSDFTPPSAPY
jgi:hypothetical protein